MIYRAALIHGVKATEIAHKTPSLNSGIIMIVNAYKNTNQFLNANGKQIVALISLAVWAESVDAASID